MTLKDLLKAFNRKESNWLIRDMLGASAERLDQDFLERTAAEVRRVDPDFRFDNSPYWAIDFHIDWLVGVFHKLAHPNEAHGTIHPDAHGMIKGSQEDIDLVIATGNTLLLIEAKGEGGWSNSQTKSKMMRLMSMTGELTDERGYAGQMRVVFLLCSPRGAPPKLVVEHAPKWTLVEDRLPHFELRRPDTHFLAVSRCDETKPSKVATHWMIRDVPLGSVDDEADMIDT